jgi:hypothetical protein
VSQAVRGETVCLERSLGQWTDLFGATDPGNPVGSVKVLWKPMDFPPLDLTPYKNGIDDVRHGPERTGQNESVPKFRRGGGCDLCEHGPCGCADASLREQVSPATPFSRAPYAAGDGALRARESQ